MEIDVIEITHHANIVLIVFLLGYLAIVIEQVVKFNKAATALLMAIACWTILFLEPDESVARHLSIFTVQMFKVSQVLFFLLGALTIVEVINMHKGFYLITEKLLIHSKKRMLWTTCIVTFFLSSVLDNLTTTIVMVSLVAKIIKKMEERWLLGGAIVIAANAGGAWTPIGDVATTLLWIGGEITTRAVMESLFLPSILGMFAALLWLNRSFKGSFDFTNPELDKPEPHAGLVLVLGICCLIFVPFFKIMTDLPAFMGMMLGVGVLWVVTDLMHYRYEDRNHLRVSSVLPKVDTSIILFYLGVLLSINALESAGLLNNTAQWLDSHVMTPMFIPIFIGLVSSVVDNVSLVAATIGMYDQTVFPVDSPFWLAVAYCAGTGGSILIVGSAAGVALMALEKVDFMWYTKHIAIPALLTYFAGFGTYLLINALVA